MKKILTIIFALLIYNAIAQCPTSGEEKSTPRLHALDILKNRSVAPASKPKQTDLKEVFKPGNDTARFNEKDYVELTGYVYLVKRGGPESCNCKTDDKNGWDIHIEILNNLKDNPKYCMVIEINRYTIALHPEFRYQNILKLKGKKVKFSGYWLADVNHKQNSRNTNPEGTDIFRGTIWEIHPVLNIEVVD